MEDDREHTKKESRTYDGGAWDVITVTPDGGVIWRRYGDRRIVVTRGREQPQDVVAKYERSGGN